MIVYVDLIFLFNLLMDGAMLYTCGKIRKIKLQWWRLLLSSSIGASYVVMMFFPQLSFLFPFLVKISLSLLMIAVAFRYVSLRNYLLNLGVFYIVNFVAAGGILGIKYLLQNSSDVVNGILYTHTGGLGSAIQIGITFVVIVACIMLILIRKLFDSQKKQDQITTYLAEVEVKIEQFHKTCTGMIDTGNQLYDPLTRTPVMIMEAALFEGVIPDDWVHHIRSAKGDQLITDLALEVNSWQDRLRFVPYRGVNRSTTFMLAIKPDEVTVSYHNRELTAHKVLIGLDGGQLSRDRTYQAIIHPALIAEE